MRPGMVRRAPGKLVHPCFPTFTPRTRDLLEQVSRYGIPLPIATERLHLTPTAWPPLRPRRGATC